MEFPVYFILHSVVLLVSATVIRPDDGFKRNVSTVKHCKTDCKPTDSCPCVTHTMAVGNRDTLHYIFAMHSAPTLLTARTGQPVNITVAWDKFLAGNGSTANSVKFDPDVNPDTVVALMFTKLIEFADVNGTANLDLYARSNKSWIQSYSFVGATWSHFSMANDEIEFNITQMENVLPSYKNGSISFKVRVFPGDGFTSELPHLPISANISVIGVTFDNLVTNSETSRFAVEMVLITSDNLGKNMDISKRNSFDDSLTPGQFSYTDWVTDDGNESKGAFLQWKPVCYNSASRNIASSMKTGHYSLANFSVEHYEKYQSGLAFAYFGSLLMSGTHMKASNLSFGGAGDDNGMFFNVTGYTSWTVSLGYGAPPIQPISLLIILVISIGLGIPFLLIIAGIVFIIVKRCRDRHEGYTRISGGYEEIN